MKKKSPLVIAFFLILLISCSEKSVGPGDIDYEPALIGKVTDSAGNPLTGVNVHYVPELLDSSLKKGEPYTPMPSTRIHFSLPVPARVTLVILAPFTRDTVLYMLKNEFMNAGTHSADINLDTLTNGVYIYVLKYDTTEIESSFLIIRDIQDLPSTMPLVRTDNQGNFKLHYKRLGIGKVFPFTSEASPVIIGYRIILNRFKIFLVKEGYNNYSEDLAVDTTTSMRKTFRMIR